MRQIKMVGVQGVSSITAFSASVGLRSMDAGQTAAPTRVETPIKDADQTTVDPGKVPGRLGSLVSDPLAFGPHAKTSALTKRYDLNGELIPQADTVQAIPKKVGQFLNTLV
jgi:hypothetical protein